MAEINEDVKRLRERLGDSQQSFAVRLGLSVRAITNYEKDRKPIGKVLVAMHRLARSCGENELAEKFWNAVHDDLGLSHKTARMIDNASAEVDQALVRLTLFLQRETLTPAQRKDLQNNILSRLKTVQSILDGLDPFSLTPGEEPKQ